MRLARAFAGLMMTVVVACYDRAAARLPADSVALPSTRANAATPAIETVPAEVRTACAEVAASWRSVPAVTLREIADTTIEDLFQDTDKTRHACAVDLDDSVAFAPRDSARVKHDGPAKSPYWRSFASAGWTVLKYSADGPDGSDQEYQRGRVRCLLIEEWDGGDDGDSTYVPSPFYRQLTSCWSYPHAIADSDTVPQSARLP